MKWLAVKSALGELDSRLPNWGNTIPIMIQLRKYPNGRIDIKNIIEEITCNIVKDMPDGWIEEIFKSGRVLLLVDGLDELKSEHRELVQDWIESLLEQYDFKVILTSRPGAVEHLYYVSEYEFSAYTISNMSLPSIKEFIVHWHNAILKEEKSNIELMTDSLYQKIRMSSSIHRLASNPLMCALLCALHHDRNMKLPVNRSSLYEECTTMLLERRDSDRKIESSSYSSLSYLQKRIIFDHIAYWMLKNNLTMADKNVIEEVITSKLGHMNTESEIDPKELLTSMLERSGMIREVEIGKIDFIHKTFQEYMAANAATREKDWGLLYCNRDNDLWNQTIILSVNFANQKDTDDFLYKLLEADSDAIKSKLIAFQCLETANELSADCRDEVLREIKKIIPPNGDDEVNALISSGDIAVNALTYNPAYSEVELSNCLFVLGRIGTTAALSVIETYIMSDPNERIIDRLASSMEYFDIDSISNSNIPELIENYYKKALEGKIVYINWNLIEVLSPIRRVNLTELFNRKIQNLRISNLSHQNAELLYSINDVNSLFIEGDVHNVALDAISKYENLHEITIVLDQYFDSNLMILANNENLSSLNLVLESDHYKFLDLSYLNDLESLQTLRVIHRGNGTLDESLIYGLSELRNISELELSTKNDLYLQLVDSGEQMVNLKTLKLECKGFISISAIYDVFGLPNLQNLDIFIEDYSFVKEIYSTSKMLNKNLVVNVHEIA